MHTFRFTFESPEGDYCADEMSAMNFAEVYAYLAKSCPGAKHVYVWISR